MRLGRRAGLAPVALVLVALVGGCANAVGGQPVLPAGMKHLSLGDRSTLDPCSLLRAQDFPAKFGSVKLDSSTGFDTCTVEPNQRDSGSGDMDRTVFFDTKNNYFGDKDFDVPVDHTGWNGLDVYRGKPGEKKCVRAVVFPNKAMMRAKPHDEGDELTCALVDATIDSALKNFAAGQYRGKSYPKDSVALLDPCDNYVSSTLAMNTVGTDKNARLDARSCRWGDSSTGGVVVLTFGTGFELGGNPGESTDGIRDIAGRTSAVSQPSGSDPKIGYCVIRTNSHLHYGDDLFESTTVTMAAKVPVDQVCAKATAVATEVWPKLPKG